MEANVLTLAVKPQNRVTFTDELKRRMTFAFDRWQRRHFPKSPDQTELGRRVAEKTKRAQPYTQTAVAGWLAGKMPRDPEASDALATELGFEPGWLYFNRGDAPDGWKEARAQMIAHDKLGARGKPSKQKRA